MYLEHLEHLKKIKIDFTTTNFGFVDMIDPETCTIFIEYPSFPDPETNHYAYQYWIYVSSRYDTPILLIQLTPDEEEDMEAYALDLTPEQRAVIDEVIRNEKK
ncbi:MAG: hypothetical protein ACOX7K_10075 [Oscillospiraceae bacterium]|jgi:hypothetical protein